MVDLKKEQAYGQLALAHARMNGMGGQHQPDLPTIKPDTPEWQAWAQYFVNHLGFEPVAMKRVRQGMSKEMTVPDKLPELFDASYSPPSLLAAAQRRAVEYQN